MKPPSSPRKAVGIVRVSEVKGRDGAAFASPSEQRDRIVAACERDGLELVECIEELDVSGGTPLDARAGLRRAVEAVEAGTANVVIGAYFDRLVRSLRVQAELVERVEAAGGSVLALDVGEVTNGSAGQWLSGTMLGAVSEYQRRTSAERSAEAQARAVGRGAVPWPHITPGYLRGDDGRLTPDPVTAPVVAEAFRLRADGASVADVRVFLARRGIERSHHGTAKLLQSRVVLGEIHFGELVNLKAHEPIVDAGSWRRAQRAAAPRGRLAKSERLLARQGVLRCATCGGRMVASTQRQSGKVYPFYRCPSQRADCAKRVTVGAELVERVVTDRVREVLANHEGRASAEQGARDAALALERAQADLDAALRVLSDFGDEQAARDRLAELRTARDAAQGRVDQLGGRRTAVTITASADWDLLSLGGRRNLIRAVVERVDVAPGRGAGRVSVQLVGE